MLDASTYVGMDVHKQSIVVAVLGARGREFVEWRLSNDGSSVQRLVRRLRKQCSGSVICCYEAGPFGYGLQRQLEKEGVRCLVVAPSLIPRKPGDRIKTDRRDARTLAEHLRAGTLTPVHPPSEEQEAARELCRAREDVLEELQRQRQRIQQMLLRRGIRCPSGKAWGARHRTWLWNQQWSWESEQAVWEDLMLHLEQLESRLKSFSAKLETLAATDPYQQTVGWLRCFHGVDTLSAMTLLTELYSFGRFGSPRQLMAYLGLVPSEHSSGESTRRGSITKAGNRHVRRILIQAAHHYRHRPRVGAALRKRRENQPPAVIALTERAHERLHRRYLRLLLGRNKPAQKVVTALARELAGFVWAVLARPQSMACLSN